LQVIFKQVLGGFPLGELMGIFSPLTMVSVAMIELVFHPKILYYDGQFILEENPI